MPDIDYLERRTRRLEQTVRIQGSILALAFCAWLLAMADLGYATSGEGEMVESLTVSELVVVDDRGVARVRIGGNLPDAVIDGKRVDRGAEAAGVMLYDTTGQERGGYVTWDDDNVGLTLDTQKGQVALLAAGPDEGAVIRIWHGNDAIGMRSDSAGSRLIAVKDGGIVFQNPTVEKVIPEACTAYREHAAKGARQEALDACRTRFPEAACRECLEE